MGALADLANQVFRNFRVDGDPSSGQHNPRKEEVRDVFATADASLAASTEAVAGAADAVAAAGESAIDDIAAELANAVGAIDATEATAVATVQSYAAALSGTSTTSLTIGTGAKVFVTQAGKQWVDGQRLRAASDDGTKIMEGEVSPYSGTSLTLLVDYIEGEGDHDDWSLSIAGARGAQGAGSSGSPIVILATGQSNVRLDGAFDWAPPPNLFLWDFDKTDATDVGTSFTSPSTTVCAVGRAFAAKVAQDNPLRDVYILEISIGGQPLSKWMTGSPTPDLYAACKNNVEAALTLIGADKIDTLLWWQGEAEAQSGSLTYVADWQSVHARFRGETWFPYTTPVVIMGVSALAGSIYENFNRYFSELVSLDPDCLVYVHTSRLPVAYWDGSGGTPYIHMLGEGYSAAGSLAYQALEGPRRAGFLNFWADPNPSGQAHVGSLTNPQRVMNFWNNTRNFQIQAINSGDRIRITAGSVGDLLSLASLGSPSVGDTALSIRGRNTAGTGLLVVTLGATDSGGTGFRALRVPN